MNARLVQFGVSATYCLLCATASGHEPIVTTNILQRVHQVRWGGQLGTAFVIDFEGGRYLITARHVLAGAKTGDNVEVARGNQWMQITAQVVPVAPPSVDIAILALPEAAITRLPLIVDSKDLALSQEVYFLGYPFGLAMDGTDWNSGFPVPFVKRGVVSAFLAQGDGAQVIVIDGINNPGFSGGPVVFQHDPSGRLAVGAVVSGYRNEEQDVVDQGKATGLKTKGNSGLVITWDISSVVKAIRAFKGKPSQ